MTRRHPWIWKIFHPLITHYFPPEDIHCHRKNHTFSIERPEAVPGGVAPFCRTDLPIYRYHRQPSADFLFEQIRNLIQETGVRAVLFTDDEGSPRMIEKLCGRFLAANLRFIWGIAFRFDRGLTLDRLKTFRLAGCSNISLGFESYNDRVLGLMDKGTSVELIDQNLASMLSAGIRPSLSAIAGFPTETEAEARRTFEKLVSLKHEGHAQSVLLLPFMILHGSRVASDPEAFQIMNLETPVEFDLKPPIFWFESPGMSRGRAFQMAHEFRLATRDPIPKGKASDATRQLTCFGQKIPLAYDTNHLRNQTATIMTRYRTQSGLTSVQMLERGNAKVDPVRRGS